MTHSTLIVRRSVRNTVALQRHFNNAKTAKDTKPETNKPAFADIINMVNISLKPSDNEYI